MQICPLRREQGSYSFVTIITQGIIRLLFPLHLKFWSGFRRLLTGQHERPRCCTCPSMHLCTFALER